jgi:hypothetical protein
MMIVASANHFLLEVETVETCDATTIQKKMDFPFQ